MSAGGHSSETDSRTLDALLDELLDLELPARALRLAALPEAQRSRLSSLLAAALDDDDFLRRGGAMDAAVLDEVLRGDQLLESGAMLGPYRILREIGAGGMGRVFLGERADGLFAREVALKLLEPGTAPDGLARLQREQRILASLVHPNIARLYDAGLTAEGAPYLVMEHVDGEPIDAWCRRQGLDARQRLQLLTEVCAAVDAAHQRLIVHRDIKPSNVLVDSDGQVKLLDFGIARILDDQDTDSAAKPAAPLNRTTSSTQTHGRAWLTPRYASPEQRAGAATSTASDVYQLGLLAWELLAGRAPPAVTADGVLPPLTPLSGEASGAALPAADLDAVLAMALADDPAHRYASADRLREDLQRLLDGYPVAARPAGSSYRLRRLVLRHRLASVALATGLLLVIGLSAAFTLRLAAERDATRLEAEQAERARIETEQVVVFLTDLFRAGDPFALSESRPVAELSARELLDRSASRLQETLIDQPLVRARLLDEVARIYRMLGLPDESEPLVRESLRLRSTHPQAHALQIADAELALGRIQLLRGEHEQAATSIAGAEHAFRDAGDQRRLAAALEAKGNLLLARGEPGSIEAFEASLFLWQSVGNSEREADLHSYLANALASYGRVADARRHREAALALIESQVGPQHPALAGALVGLADQYKSERNVEPAVPLLQRALAIFEANFDQDDFRIGIALNNLGTALSDTGDQEAALLHLERALAIYRAQRPEHPAIGTILNNLGTIAWEQNQAQAAAEHYREALAHLAPQLREDHLMIALIKTNLGEALFALNAYAEAQPFLERGLAHLEHRLGAQHPMLAPSLFYLARILERDGDLQRAEQLLRRALAIHEADTEGDPLDLAQARDALKELLHRRSAIQQAL